MANPFLEIADALNQMADALPSVMGSGIERIAKRAVELLKERWPRRTGYSASQWVAYEFGEGWVITCPPEYSSFVHAKGDDDRTPIYIDMVTKAVEDAAQEVGFDLILTDMTKEYLGKGWKFQPTNILYLEVFGKVEPDTAASVPLVRTDYIPGGQGGTRVLNVSKG